MGATALNPLRAHVWGRSQADRVWAQIAGIAPSSRPWERLFMVLQGYFDESYTKDSVFVLAGYIASAEAWADFSREWEALLPLAKRGPDGTRRFKMSEMANRMDDVQAFYRVIESHAAMSMECKIDLGDLRRAKERIWMENVPLDWDSQKIFYDDPYQTCFYHMIETLHQDRTALDERGEKLRQILGEEKIDFYFDKHSSQAAIEQGWDSFVSSRSESTKRFYETKPHFEKEEVFLPLQAADFRAWWVREGFETGTIDRLIKGDYGYWKENKRVPVFGAEFNEDHLTYNMRSFAQARVGHGVAVYDAKYHPRPQPAPNRPSLITRARSWLSSSKRGQSS